MLQKGDRIGNWLIERPLGEGGMGAVFVARHQLLDELSALKVLKPVAMEHARERFVRELKVLRSLEHPAVVKMLEGGLDEGRGLLYMAMELLSGETLLDRMTRGPIPEPEVVPLFRRIAEGLDAAHSRGIFHRDLKPENLFLTDKGPKILDFGIAVQDGATRYTQQGLVPGTPMYMPPEVFTGEVPDPRLGDIYALGLMLGECITGEQAFVIPDGLRPSQAQLRLMSMKANNGPLDVGPNVHPALRGLVTAATHPSPARRPRDLSPFLLLDPAKYDALQQALPPEPQAAGATMAFDLGANVAESKTAFDPRASAAETMAFEPRPPVPETMVFSPREAGGTGSRAAAGRGPATPGGGTPRVDGIGGTGSTIAASGSAPRGGAGATGSFALAAGGIAATGLLALAALVVVALVGLYLGTRPPAAEPVAEATAAPEAATPIPEAPSEATADAEEAAPIAEEPTPSKTTRKATTTPKTGPGSPPGDPLAPADPPPPTTGPPDPPTERPPATTGPLDPPSPKMEPEPAPAPRGALVFASGMTNAALVGPNGRYALPARVPAGTYAIRADFGDGEARVGQLEVLATDQKVQLRCDPGFGMCQASR